MKTVFIVKWLWSEPYEQMEGILSVHSSLAGAEKTKAEYLKDNYNPDDPWDYAGATIVEEYVHD